MEIKINIQNMIQDFIKENDLSFEEGNRNTTVVTLIGFAQHLDMSITDLKMELQDEIKNDNFIGEEIDRLFSYCKAKNYKKYWSTPEAKTAWKF